MLFVGLYRFKKNIKEKTKETVKQESLNYLMENDKFEEPRLEEIASSITDFAEAITMVKRYEDMIKTQNKKVINLVGK